MQKVYSRIQWKNEPSHETPINERNLNKMDYAVDVIDERVLGLDNTKADKTEFLSSITDVSVNNTNGYITVTWANGTVRTYDTLLEKIATNFDYNSTTQKLIITLSDGTTKNVDLSALITQYEFVDSSTITSTVNATGAVTHSVKKGSITDEYIEGGYLTNAQAAEGRAKGHADAAATSEAAAAASKTAAKASETAAAASEASAAASKESAANSATAAATSATAAAASEAAAATSETNAANSAIAAATSATNAATSAANAAASEAAAATSKAAAAASETAAKDSENAAAESETNAKSYEDLSRSYAVGTSNAVRDGDEEDNSKYYCLQTRALKQDVQTLKDSIDDISDQVNKKLDMVTFDVDENGFLTYSDGSGYRFWIDDGGYLNWEVA